MRNILKVALVTAAMFVAGSSVYAERNSYGQATRDGRSQSRAESDYGRAQRSSARQEDHRQIPVAVPGPGANYERTENPRRRTETSDPQESGRSRCVQLFSREPGQDEVNNTSSRPSTYRRSGEPLRGKIDTSRDRDEERERNR